MSILPQQPLENAPIAVNKNGAWDLPYNIELESALLGAILRNNNLYDDVVVELIPVPDYFYHPIHQQIYGYIMSLKNKGQVATPAALRHFFKNMDDKENGMDEDSVGEYLNRIVAEVPSLLHIKDYATTINDLYRRRQLMAIGENIVLKAQDLSDPDTTANSQLEEAEEQLFNLAEHGSLESGLESLDKIGTRLIDHIEQRRKNKLYFSGVPSGFSSIDEVMGGLNRSDLFVLASRPGMGKTAFAISLAAQVAGLPLVMDAIPEENLPANQKEKRHVLFFSLEMSAEQLASRILSQMTGVTTINIRRKISDDDFQKFCQAMNDLRDSKLFIDDTPGLSIAALRQRARRAKRRLGGKLDLLVVDYLQLMQPSRLTRHDSRVAEITEISRGLKMVAKELDVPLLALSQLSRDIEKRQSGSVRRIPQLSDLRDSGSIEQDADIVGFLYREEYYLEQKMKNTEDENEKQKIAARMPEVKNKAELHIAKHRHGPTTTLPFHFNNETSQFSETAMGYIGDAMSKNNSDDITTDE